MGEAFFVALELSSKETKNKANVPAYGKKLKLIGTLYRHVVESTEDSVVKRFSS